MTTDPPPGQVSGPASGLGPHCLGVRVVVRHVVPGETGPSGGPALTDVLGVLVDWGRSTLTVRREDGSDTVVDRATVVAGKPVPPRPPVRLRVPLEVVERRAVEGWPPVEREGLGDWLLRASGGFSARANSALLLGDPGVPWDEALATVVGFYRARDLLPRVQTMSGSAEEARLEAAGWVNAPGYDVPVTVRLAGVAGVRRALARLAPDVDVTLHDRLTPAWLAVDERARQHGAAARAVLEGPDRVRFATVLEGGSTLAKGRASLSDGTELWVGLTDLWVSPTHRRGGLSAAVLGSLLAWAAEQGATTAYLQVRLDNAAALELYDRLGFVEHHTYRYLTPPA